MPSDATADLITDGDTKETRPGAVSEHLLQQAYGTQERAAKFYADQLRDRLLPVMVEFIGRMEMMFLSTADGHGECDASLRAGPKGFIRVLDERHLAYPEYRGNGVHASLANISENPHVGLLMMDFERDLVGLHVNGRARIVDHEILRTLHPEVVPDPEVEAGPGRRVERWVVIEVAEAYIHCRKHIPRMARVYESRDWGTDDPARKGGDYFGARAERVTVETSPAGSEGDAGSVGDSGPAADFGCTAAPGGANPAEDPRSADPAADSRGGPQGAPATLPIPVQRESESDRPRFPSTTHLMTGAATARPLRSPSRAARAARRLRWLSS